MSQEILIGNGYYQVFVALNYALAGQPGIQARIDGPVYKIFFFIANFRQVVGAGFYVNVAGAAAANAAAVMLQLYMIIEGHIQHRFAFYAGERLVGLPVGKLKGNIYYFHRVS